MYSLLPGVRTPSPLVPDHDDLWLRGSNNEPLGYAGGQWNLTAYCDNDPVNYTDPTGLIGDRFEKLSRKEQDLFFQSLEIQYGNYLARGMIGYAINIEDDGGPAAYDYEKELTKAKEIIAAKALSDAKQKREERAQKLKDCESNFPPFPEVLTEGPSHGTPKKPTGDGLAIAIFGVRDNPLYEDYSSDPKHDAHSKDYIRPNTSKLPNNSVTDISVRAAPLRPVSWKEIVRIAKPGATITWAYEADGHDAIMNDIVNWEGGNYYYKFGPTYKLPGNVTMRVIQIRITCEIED